MKHNFTRRKMMKIATLYYKYNDRIPTNAYIIRFIGIIITIIPQLIPQRLDFIDYFYTKALADGAGVFL